MFYMTYSPLLHQDYTTHEYMDINLLYSVKLTDLMSAISSLECYINTDFISRVLRTLILCHTFTVYIVPYGHEIYLCFINYPMLVQYCV